ncbi:hypothetical protein FP026_16660 [Rhizobium tropici]|uniref:Uncharacterized protein n=1 Tax=Rhizobium tropici TaxID=398 RepID=A0A5B0W3G8_RHITR|nr:hypothetical protein [Rhizobium tropici]KAA1180459.1 hypothetical protein FP026_16660 [Rhizobium tropici]
MNGSLDWNILAILTFNLRLIGELDVSIQIALETALVTAGKTIDIDFDLRPASGIHREPE